jgi:uncharacterized protein YbaP (TraB family)
LTLEAPSLYGRSEQLGVEEYLIRRAQTNRKPIVGLESAREHMEIFSGLSDRQSEAYLLLIFIPATNGSASESVTAAWRRGDPDVLTHSFQASFQDFPSLSERLLDIRNRAWIPKIEEYLRSGQTYFVVVGAAHIGGPNGVLSLLRRQGYRVEQL